MRTREARKLRKKNLRHARIFGHQPELITHSGALALYGCHLCEAIMEVWDSPAIVNGPMSQLPCCGAKKSRIRKFFIRLISR